MGYIQDIAANTAEIKKLTAALAASNNAIDKGWIMCAGVLVFFMNAGFALLESGTVRFKNFQNIMLKNVFDALVSGVIFFAWGFAFAYGDVATSDGGNGFIGTKYFFCNGIGKPGASQTFADWWFQYAFAATAMTIVSGSLAERVNMYAYVCFALVLTGFVYPVVVAWTWGGGWLTAMGYSDFAGSGIVHLVGGVAGVTGAIIVGPRLGRFTDARTGEKLVRDLEAEEEANTGSYEQLTSKYLKGDIEIEHLHSYIRAYGTTLQEKGFSAYSPNNIVLGTMILWVGWMFFNGGSSLGLSDPNDGWTKASLAMVNTIIAPSAAGITSFFTRKYITGQNHEYRLDFNAIGNGILAGAVSITAGCADVEPWAALIIGILGAFVYCFAVLLLEKLQIDDPVEATQVHGFCGFWGCLALGLFHTEKGLLYGGGGKLLGANALGCLCIALWTSFFSFLYFFTLKKVGVLRLSISDELLGGDVHYFAPIKFQGKVSTYTKGLALTRLNTSYIKSPAVIAANKADEDSLMDESDEKDANEDAKPNILKPNGLNGTKLGQVSNDIEQDKTNGNEDGKEMVNIN